MYDHISGVEVYVKEHRPGAGENDDRYQEYEVPRRSSQYTGDPLVRYIEAVTDQRFEIVVALHEDFSFKGHSSVQIYHDIDDDSQVAVAFLERSQRPKQGEMRHRCYEAHVPVDGVWKSYGFLFGATRPSENVHLSAEEEATEVKQRGVITVYLERGKTTKCNEPHNGTTGFREPKTRSSETSKAVAIQHGKSHALKTITLKDAMDGPRFPLKNWTRAKGKGSEQLKFTIYYTSRMFLEKEGIIPTSRPLHHQLSVGSSANANANETINGSNIECDPCGEDPCGEDQPVPSRYEIGSERDTNLFTAGRAASMRSRSAVQLPNTQRETRGNRVSQGAPSNLEMTGSAVPSESSHARKRRRTNAPTDVVDLCGDEDISPPLNVKAEPGENTDSLYGLTPPASDSNTGNFTPRIKSEPQSHQAVDDGSNTVPVDFEGIGPSTKPTNKAKERAMINLQLEEIKLKKRLMELDGEDDG